MREIPGIECLVLAIMPFTLYPGSCPPSPGFAPWATLIWISSALTRYSVVTPKRPDATCLTLLFNETPSLVPLKRASSSPPSPVLLLLPNLLSASAMVS